ncbi:uncharacterized protein BKCO1_3000235 [Diplodia corticola]|uniref:Uncharacterized protein n=1 Tax=Diplodia corticola TaxID=236234 RepID=A0A1J9S247_9PEZI|nr:uncharacterized protein BKCO1_3000235 [Diplodia corticola]OJD39035.1 hypothetical protein BKCO1_3000235 [Diplodia corticola]
MDPSQLDDLDTRLQICTIGSPTVPPPPTAPAAGTHFHPRVVSAPAARTPPYASRPEDEEDVGDISNILTLLCNLRHVKDPEILYAALLRQAWAAYRARGLPPAQFRTLVDAECGPQRENLAAMLREIEMRNMRPQFGNDKAEIEDMMREYQERSVVLRQREEMLLSVLPEGEREGWKWEPTADQFREGMPTEEDLALLVRSVEEREEERSRKRAGRASPTCSSYR